MKPDKEYFATAFCFHQKKSAADARRFIYETYDENVIAIGTCELI